jgi:hypothetical protein
LQFIHHEVRSLFSGVQFIDVHQQTAVENVRFASPEQFVRLEMMPSYLESPAAQVDDSSLSVLISEVNTALQSYVSREGLAFPMEALLVTAHK